MAAPCVNFPPLPQILKPLQPYLKIAGDVERLDPVVAYWCRFYIVQAGLKIDSKSKESITFLSALMNWLEKEKKLRHDNESITNEMAAQAHFENFALKLFNKADTDDREGRIDIKTSKLFYLSSYLFDVLTVFGEVPEEITKRAKYGKWKATYISKCLKTGETPIPGPVGGSDAPDDFGFYEGIFDQIEAKNQNQISNNDAESSLPNDTPNYDTPSQSTTHAPTPAARSITPTPSARSTTSNVPDQSYQSTTTTIGSTGISPEHLAKAQKYCKYAASALQYEDITTAIDNLQNALSLLTTKKDN